MSKHNGDRHSPDLQPEQLTAYALGQLRGEELAAVKAALGESNLLAQAEVREVQTLAAAVSAARNAQPLSQPSPDLRAAVEAKLAAVAATAREIDKVALPERSFLRWPSAVEWGVLGGICCVLVALLLPAVQASREAARRTQAMNNLKQLALDREFADRPPAASVATADPQSEPMRYQNNPEVASLTGEVTEVTNGERWDEALARAKGVASHSAASITQSNPTDSTQDDAPAVTWNSEVRSSPASASSAFAVQPPVSESRVVGGQSQLGGQPGSPRSGPSADLSSSAGGYPSPAEGYLAPIDNSPGYGSSMPSSAGAGYGNAARGSGGPAMSVPPVTRSAAPVKETEVQKYYFELERLAQTDPAAPNYPTPVAQGQGEGKGLNREMSDRYFLARSELERSSSESIPYGASAPGEQYEAITENQFLAPTTHPLSTFSIDVDTASYANVRRFLTAGQLPPPAAVRIEELVNYFTYSYPQPKAGEPFSVNMEAAECPWRPGHLLLRVGLKGKEVHRAERPPSNLTFLLDVSGSMSDENKLPLLKTALAMFVGELTDRDRVSIVTYAGDAGLRLPPTPGHEKQKILAAIDSLSAGGSTHGSAGIQLAYEQAGQYFLKDGTNRVILATDGDLNVGVTSDDALVQLIKQKAADGTFLTVLGFGTGNLKDAKLEKLADNGNGIYAYIDGVREGRKVLVEQMSGSLVTIAKDVKIQIEFNPAQIASYRLLGYENRVLAARDFNDDTKDAGEIGAGHTVTALYELVPVGVKDVAAPAPGVEPLKYQASERGQRSEIRGQGSEASERRQPPDGAQLTDAAKSGELLTLKLRYKEPDGQASKLLEYPLKDRGGQFNAASKDLQFAAAVASFGMILRGSEHRGSGNLLAVAEIASGSLGEDPSGYRAELVDLVRRAQALGAK